MVSLDLVNSMEKERLIAPSILNADFCHLEDEILKVKNLGVKILHFDVMDGHFVPNLSFGAPVLKCIGHKFELINDVHLMISNPKDFVKDFATAGADILTFHFEAIENEKEIFDLIEYIRSFNMKVGISIKPKTEVEAIKKYLDHVDQVLVMSVEPGFGGQSFMESAYDKIKELDDIRKYKKLDFKIEVDGGINDKNSAKLFSLGAEILVCGTYLYKSANIKEDYGKLFR